MSGLRSLVDRCAAIALAAGVVLAAVVAALSPLAGDRGEAIAVGAASLPLIAAANVYLGATRGLKKMGPTLWVFWIGQPVAWIGLAAVAIASGGGVDAAVAAYGVSWLGATVGGARALAAGGGVAGGAAARPAPSSWPCCATARRARRRRSWRRRSSGATCSCSPTTPRASASTPTRPPAGSRS